MAVMRDVDAFQMFAQIEREKFLALYGSFLRRWPFARCREEVSGWSGKARFADVVAIAFNVV